MSQRKVQFNGSKQPRLSSANSAPNRKHRLLWANLYCLLDTSSGASMSVRQMLHQLVKSGYEVEVIGATIFDAPKGTTLLKPHWDAIKDPGNTIIEVTDGPLLHRLITTQSEDRDLMTAKEMNRWYRLFIQRLASFKPDLVWFYGGDGFTSLIPHEAQVRGIPSAAYTPNGSYTSTRWCRDVDLIITDTEATANYYREVMNFSPVSVGKFIPPENIIAKPNSRKYVTFINPSLAKGVVVVIQLAIALAKRRPDIKFEIVESRGDWHGLVTLVCKMLGEDPAALTNVVITPNQADMRTVYGRSRVLLAPSFWWESGARVLVEAMMNGIPAIVSKRGGNVEMVQDAGIIVEFPNECYEKPYDRFPKPELLLPVIERIERLYDDPHYYQYMSEKALAVAAERHDMAVSTKRLLKAFAPFVSKRAGDKPHNKMLQAVHKHGLPPDLLENLEHRVEPQSPLVIPLTEGERGLFIDCGGHDGCSAVKFMLHNPQFDSITFEPNPVMWPHYAEVPSTLIKKAAYTHGGSVSFKLDETDGDGSTLIDTKKVDYWGKVANEDCPKIDVESVDIAELVREALKTYQHIVLKLDIEGAEYDVLEKLLKENLVKHLKFIYAEFHWKQCGFPESRHTALVDALLQQTQVAEWDALDYAVYQRSVEIREQRVTLLKQKLGDIAHYQNLSLTAIGLSVGEGE
jgi:FkbM family methyltransferase